MPFALSRYACRMRRSITLPLLLLAPMPAPAEQIAVVPDPVFSAAMRALFDTPAAITRTILPPRETGDPSGVVRCYRYPGLTVQEVDYGEHGDQSIFVTPYDVGKPLPTCGPVAGRLEKQLFDSEESYFLGAKAQFGFVVSTSGRDGTPFTIHNLASNFALYADELATDSLPSTFTVAGNVLTIEYIRAAHGSCSIVSGGAACWTAFATEARLPPEIANAPAPFALCAKGYAAAFGGPADPIEPSVLNYTVRVALNAAPEIDKVIQAGPITSCNPQS